MKYFLAARYAVQLFLLRLRVHASSLMNDGSGLMFKLFLIGYSILNMQTSDAMRHQHYAVQTVQTRQTGAGKSNVPPAYAVPVS